MACALEERECGGTGEEALCCDGLQCLTRQLDAGPQELCLSALRPQRVCSQRADCVQCNLLCMVIISRWQARRVQQTVSQMYANDVEVMCCLCSLRQSRRFVRKQPQLL